MNQMQINVPYLFRMFCIKVISASAILAISLFSNSFLLCPFIDRGNNRLALVLSQISLLEFDEQFTKLLLQVASEKGNEGLKPWVSDITNHFYYSAEHCGGQEMRMKVYDCPCV